MKKFIFFIYVFLLCVIPLQASANSFKEMFTEAVGDYNRGEYSKALRTFEVLEKVVPNFPATYNYLGLCHQALEANLDKTRGYFLKAIALDPNNSMAYENLSKVEYNIGDFDKAEEYGLKAVEFNPQSIGANLSLGWIYLLGKSQPIEAAYYFEKAVKDQDVPSGLFGLGIAYYMNDNRIPALDIVTRLRGMGQDSMATEIENMIRDSNYKPRIPIGGPQLNASQRSVLVDDAPIIDTSQVTGVPVRLGSTQPKKLSESAVENVLSGAERIRQLRERGISSYPVSSPNP